MLQIFGVVLITVLCSVLVTSFCDGYDKTEYSYRDILTLLYVMKDKISAHSMPLSSILNVSIQLPYLSEIDFVETARESGFVYALENNRNKLMIDEQDYEMLYNFFLSLGCSTRSYVLENLSCTIKELEKKYEQTKALTIQKKKVSSTVIVCSFLILIIFLI